MRRLEIGDSVSTEIKESPVVESGKAGHLDKDGRRITITNWDIHEDGSLTIVYNQNKREDPIFKTFNNCWYLTEGTSIVLHNRTGSKNVTLSQDAKCQASSEAPCVCTLKFANIKELGL